MKFIKTEGENLKNFEEQWPILESSFPGYERREKQEQLKLIQKGPCSMYGVYENEEIIGVFTDWDLGDFLLIEHLAIKRELRGKGYGTRLLDAYLTHAAKTVILEVERPDTGEAQKRITFYEKSGFILNSYDYIQPPYSKTKEPVPMFLMSYPSVISEKGFPAVRKEIHKSVYGLSKPMLTI